MARQGACGNPPDANRPLAVGEGAVGAAARVDQASMRLYFMRCGVSLPTRFLWSASYSV